MPSVTRTIHFEKTQERYELTASPACVHLDGGGNQTETVTVRLMHYKGKESEEITGKSVTVIDGENSANFTLPAEINQSGSTVISQSLDDREHGAPDSLTVIGILGANNLVIPVVHDGMGVSKADIVFAVGTSQSESPNFSANSPTSATSLITYDNREYYLWQCTMITYTTGSPTFNGYQCLGQVKTFASVTEQYATGTASAATSSWVNDSPASLSRNKGSYLWTRTKLSYNSGNPSYSPNESGTCIGYLGIDGENAVTVQISPEAILHKKATTSSQYSLAIRVWNGKTAIPASGFSANIQSKASGLSEYAIPTITGSYYNYIGISIGANIEVNGDITIAVTYNGNTYTKVVPFKTVVNGDPGIKGEKGATMRGPQNYTDLSDGYYFQAGKEGEEWKDVVIYNGSFYSCTVSHAKNATTDISGNTLSSDYWVVSSIQEIVATRVLLVANAFIKLASSNKIIVVNNNGVETGGMQGDTSSPIFWLKDPLTSASIEIGLNNDGTPYIKGREQGIESDNDSNYAFLLDPSKGTYDFYGPSNQRFLVNGDGLTYWDSGGRELEIDSSGGMTFFGQYVSFMRSTSGVIIPLDKFVVGKSKASSYGSWGGRKVYIDDKGYLRIHPDDDYEVYNNGSWTTVDKEHWES